MAIEWFTRAAEQGHAGGQHDLGVMYIKGQGVAQNYEMALEWFTKSAEQGGAEAQAALGVMYFAGKGTGQDVTEAYIWCKLASEGNPKHLDTLEEVALFIERADKQKAEEIYRQRKEKIRLRLEQAEQGFLGLISPQ